MNVPGDLCYASSLVGATPASSTQRRVSWGLFVRKHHQVIIAGREDWTFDTPFFWRHHYFTGALTGQTRLLGLVGPTKRMWRFSVEPGRDTPELLAAVTFLHWKACDGRFLETSSVPAVRTSSLRRPDAVCTPAGSPAAQGGRRRLQHCVDSVRGGDACFWYGDLLDVRPATSGNDHRRGTRRADTPGFVGC